MASFPSHGRQHYSVLGDGLHHHLANATKVPGNKRENYDHDLEELRSYAPSVAPTTDYDGTGYHGRRGDIEDCYLLRQGSVQPPPALYRVYWVRWIGLVELGILSFMIGWAGTAPAVVAKTAIGWYGITFETLNDLSIAGSFIYLLPGAAVIWVLNRWGTKFAIVFSSVILVAGNWITYAGAATKNFDVNIAGAVIHSLAMPFILSVPTRYSRQWFADDERTLATALPSLAYPLGSGVGALTGPYMVKPVGKWNYDMQALLIAATFTAVALPAPFLPKQPRTPPSYVASTTKLGVWASLRSLLTNPMFYLQFVAFSILVGAIDTSVTITTQAIVPYGFSQQDGANAIAILVFVGISAAMIVSPILDRTKWHEKAMKVFCVCLAIVYTVCPFILNTHSIAALYAIYALAGTFSLSIEPCVLEFQASRTHPVSPEFSSVVCWSGAKVMGAIFTILVGDVFVIKKPEEGQPVGSLFNGFVVMAGAAWLSAILVAMTGYGPFKPREESKVKGNI